MGACVDSPTDTPPLVAQRGSGIQLTDGQGVATLDSVGVEVRFNRVGASIARGPDGTSQISTTAWGRRGSLLHAASALPALERCGPPESALVDCTEKLRYDRGNGLSEWWLASPVALEQGWTLEASPRGQGDLLIQVSVGSRVWLGTDGDSARFRDSSGRVWSVREATAIDAAGQPLPARLDQSEDGDLLIRVDDSNAAYPIAIDPIYETYATLLTGGADPRFGWQLADGDYNGDGYDDVAVYSRAASGVVFVIPGGSTGMADAPTHRIVTGPSDAEMDNIGPAGDLNGDGYDDLFVGRTSLWNSAVHIHYGSASGLSESADVEITEPTTYSKAFGLNVLGEVDVDSDGLDDLLFLSAQRTSASDAALSVIYGDTSSLDTVPTVLETYTTTSSTPAWTTASGEFHDVGDLEGDGYSDLAIDGEVVYRSSSGYDFVSRITATYAPTLRSAGDVNGDGYDDLLVSSSSGALLEVYHGSSSGIPTSASTSISLSPHSYTTSSSSAALGDMDGDGYDDLFIGIEGGDGYLMTGSTTGLLSTPTTIINRWTGFGQSAVGGLDINGDSVSDLVVALPEAHFEGGSVESFLGDGTSGYASDLVVEGPGEASDYGFSVALVGDFNGDGFGDAVVGAPNGEASSGQNGAIFMYHGSADGLDWFPIDRSTGRYNSRLGESVAGLGDINADGLADLAAGAPNDEYVYVYTGSTSTAPRAWFSLEENDTDFGESIDSAGDVDGDGFDDVIVSARSNTYVYQGVTTGIDTTAMASMSVQRSGNHTTAGIGDIDGDGYDDLAVGRPANNYVNIYLGSATGPSTTVAQRIYVCSSSGCDYGAAVEGGDIDGDGYSDLVVGAPGAPGWGAVYVHYGTTTGVTVSTYDNFTSDSTQRSFGTTVAVGDLTADGYADIAVGTPDASGAFVSVFAGSASGLGSSPDVDLSDGHVDAGQGLSIGPDVNGDGHADLLAGGDEVASLHFGWTDSDGDGVSAAEDCDDTDPTVGSGTIEAYPDLDGDGYGDPLAGSMLCSATSGWVSDDTDCDDDDAATYPGAADTTGDGIDSDCDDQELCYVDVDGDGFRPDATSTVASTDTDCNDSGEAKDTDPTGDCDDTDATASPAGTELPDDSVDQDCDGYDTCLVDNDGDGYVSDAEVLVVTADNDCTDSGEAGASAPDGDCDDTDATIHPTATETVGDEIDQDCDGTEDCFTDADADGFRPDTALTVSSSDIDCSGPGEASATTPAGDCDDTDAARSPGATERTGDSLDQDCDGMEVCFADLDADSYVAADGSTVISADTDCEDTLEGSLTSSGGDCDDLDGTRNPGATEQPGDHIDQDCNDTELCFNDLDEDGYRTGVASDVHLSTDLDCLNPGEGPVEFPDGDCDDEDASRNPGAAELAGDEVDQDCDGTEECLQDADEDGYADGFGATVHSVDLDCADSGESSLAGPSGDCDDADAAIHPAAEERAGDEVDQDCDGTEQCFTDADGDGYRPDGEATLASDDLDCDDEGEASAALPAGDCADGDGSIYPGAAEVAGDGIDQDCSGEDTVLEEDPDTDDAIADTSDDGKGGCATGGTAPAGWGWLAASLLLGVRRAGRRGTSNAP